MTLIRGDTLDLCLSIFSSHSNTSVTQQHFYSLQTSHIKATETYFFPSVLAIQIKHTGSDLQRQSTRVINTRVEINDIDLYIESASTEEEEECMDERYAIPALALLILMDTGVNVSASTVHLS